MDKKIGNSNQVKDSKKNYGMLMAMSLAILFYIALYFLNKTVFLQSINKFWESLSMILPFLFMVFVVMVITLFYLKPDKIKKHLGKESGIKGFIIASVAGILSVGSAYLWYPLIAELKDKGMREKLITVFIYNRAIKLHLIPLMVFYFGIKYSAVVALLIFIFSFIIGEIVERITMVKEFPKFHN
jgi:uncharacterized membrane protein YraQ (UPF0718 family)